MSNSGQTPPPVHREAFTTHLPVVEDKPTKTNDEDHPRVVKVIGPGKYRNEYGASCVPYARAHGYSDLSGNARQWPEMARQAGYTVDMTPEVGAVLVTAENSAGTTSGHVTIQKAVPENGYVFIGEQNYQKGMETEGYLPMGRIVAVIHPVKPASRTD